VHCKVTPDATGIRLREIEEADLDTFYEQQLDPEATRMAAFPARDREAHFAHWKKILDDESLVTRTIEADGEIAGNIGRWVQDDQREIGYWIGKSFWGRGIATTALRHFVELIGERPLYGWVAQHNKGSIRVLEKVGFVFDRDEGDHVVYRID
jgi:RimJ/RimL family protein N-acetyltransferase